MDTVQINTMTHRGVQEYFYTTRRTHKVITVRAIPIPVCPECVNKESKPITNLLNKMHQDYHGARNRRGGFYEAESDYEKTGAYYFIPAYTPLLMTGFTAIHNKFSHIAFHKKKFIDVGCGYGNVMALVSLMFPHWEIYGVELFKPYITLHKELFKKYNIKGNFKIYNKNAFDIDYGDYDFIYYYHPMADVKKEKELERKIEKEMKEGSIVISPLKASSYFLNKKKFQLYITDRFNELVIYRKIAA